MNVRIASLVGQTNRQFVLSFYCKTMERYSEKLRNNIPVHFGCITFGFFCIFVNYQLIIDLNWLINTLKLLLILFSVIVFRVRIPVRDRIPEIISVIVFRFVIVFRDRSTCQETFL